MKKISNFLKWLDDRMHPVAVRDMRRSVQNRFVFFGLLLVIIGVVAVCLIGVASHHSHRSYTYLGRDLFDIIYYSTGAVLILLLPLYLSIRVGDDLSDKNNLVEISTLKPMGRTWGFFTVGFIMMFLVASIALPYMMFCYMLGGLDLPTIFLKWLAIFIIALPAVMGGIFVGTLTPIKPLRLIFTLAYVGGLLFLYIFLVDEWLDRIRATRVHQIEWAVFSSLSAFVFIWLYLLASARLASPVSNRVLPLRIFATLSCAVLYAVGVIYMLATSSHRLDFIMFWFFISLFTLTVIFTIAVCEREEPGQRVRGSISRRWWLRVLSWPFYSGSAGGILWSVITAFLSVHLLRMSFEYYFSFHRPSGYFYEQKFFSELLSILTYFILCAYVYAMTAIFVRRTILRNRISNEQTPLIFFVVFLAVVMVSGFIVYINAPEGRSYFGYARIENSPWLSLNPVNLCFMRLRGQDIEEFFRTGTKMLWGWAVIITLLLLPWFVWQYKEFKPLDEPQPIDIKA